MASPSGPRRLGEDDLAQPFLVAPGLKHPFLTLGDYFKALDLVVQQHADEILEKLPASPAGPVAPGVPTQLQITSEKHGMFYHIARAEFLLPGGSHRQIALTTALSPDAREVLRREYGLLQQLNQEGHRYLPAVYLLAEAGLKSESAAEHCLVMVGEWLDGFHEWHLTGTPQNTRGCLWDGSPDHTFLSADEINDIIRQAAIILTASYRMDNFKQIHPWHHAAGDFIVRKDGRGITVRLITARGFSAMAGFSPEDPGAALPALIMFFLNLMVRLRLDRIDGTGEPAFLPEDVLPSAVNGFFATLAEKEKNKSTGPLPVPLSEFATLIASFSAEDLMELYQPLVALYCQDDSTEADLVSIGLGQHCRFLAEALATLTNDTSVPSG